MGFSKPVTGGSGTGKKIIWETRTFTLDSNLNPGTTTRWDTSAVYNGDFNTPIVTYHVVDQPQKAIVTFSNTIVLGSISVSVYVPEGEEYGLDTGDKVVVNFGYYEL